jgi:hypothetical protein
MFHDSITRRTTRSERNGPQRAVDAAIAQHTSTVSTHALEAAEHGQHHHYAVAAGNYPVLKRNHPVMSGRRRRKRINPTKRWDQMLSFRYLQRETVRYIRRNPDNLCALLVLFFGATLLICALLSALYHTNQNKPHGSGPNDFLPHDVHHAVTVEHRNVSHTVTKAKTRHRHGKKSKSHHGDSEIQRHAEGDPRSPWNGAFHIVFPSKHDKTTREHPVVSHVTRVPPRLSKDDQEEGEYIDYGDLNIDFHRGTNTSRRQIHRDPWLFQNDFRDPTTPRDDDNDAYFAFDDDLNRNEFHKVENDPSVEPKCRRISEHRINYPNCNRFHETPRIEYHARYLNEGAYRQVMVVNHTYSQHLEKVIMKDIQYSHKFTIDDYEFTRMDAMVAERLTGSPRVYNIFGFCGQGIISEFFSQGDIERVAIPGDFKPQKNDTLRFYNDFTLEQKVMICLQMAEAVADLHGYSGGVITHQDIQLSQFLFNENATKIILNDFNQAEFMLWDDEKQDYCKYTEGRGNGDWRSPEEFYDNPLNEKVDVYSLGNNFYSVFTGLWVFYDSKDDEETQQRVKEGEKPYIDPRYKSQDPLQAKLADIIESCFTYNPLNRPSIFEVITMLRKLLKDVETRNAEKTSDET